MIVHCWCHFHLFFFNFLYFAERDFGHFLKKNLFFFDEKKKTTKISHFKSIFLPGKQKDIVGRNNILLNRFIFHFFYNFLQCGIFILPCVQTASFQFSVFSQSVLHTISVLLPLTLRQEGRIYRIKIIAKYDET